MQTADELLRALGYDAEELPAIEVDGRDPLLPSWYRVDELSTAFILATHAAAAIELGEKRVRLDTREAAAAFKSEAYVRVDGKAPGDLWASLSGDYRAGDGRWIRLHCNFEHHAQAALRTLGAKNDRAAVERAVAKWNAVELEEAVIANAGAAAAERSPEEWQAHPQSAVVARRPLVRLHRIGDAPPAQRSFRVLDLTRVIAGPVAGRTLAAYGADVLLVGARSVPQIPLLVVETGFGKRFAEIDLRDDAQRATMRTLIQGADVFLESYRPGALAGLGFAPSDVAATRPGIVYASLSAYGADGPWGGRRGFDSLVQTATGITRAAARKAGRDAPMPLPAQALDHGSGWLAALGILAARHRQRREGGSWHVEVSLARTAAHLASLGFAEPSRLQLPSPSFDDVRDMLRDDESPFGSVTHMRFPGQIGDRNLQWRTPPHPQGYDAPAWPA
jgi:crotonobetainyl-CoA:carnitine CoA-transferase CaiB-like acyl-CoA transferase